MMVKTYEDALASIGMRASEIEFPDFDPKIKPSKLPGPVDESWAEAAILDRQAYMLFE